MIPAFMSILSSPLFSSMALQAILWSIPSSLFITILVSLGAGERMSHVMFHIKGSSKTGFPPRVIACPSSPIFCSGGHSKSLYVWIGWHPSAYILFLLIFALSSHDHIRSEERRV